MRHVQGRGEKYTARWWGKRPLWRPRRKWQANIKMYLKEIDWGRGVDWIDLAQDRIKWRPVVKVLLEIRGPLKTSNFLTSRRTATFSRRDLFHAGWQGSIRRCGRSMTRHNAQISSGGGLRNNSVMMRPQRESDHSPPSRFASTLWPTSTQSLRHDFSHCPILCFTDVCIVQSVKLRTALDARGQVPRKIAKSDY